MYFTHFSKIVVKTINPCLIALKFGTDKQNIKANFHIKFCMNLINAQDVINDHRVKITRVSRLLE